MEKNRSFEFEVPDGIRHGVFEDVRQSEAGVELPVQLVEVLILLQLGVELLLVLVELALRLDQPLDLLGKGLVFPLEWQLFCRPPAKSLWRCRLYHDVLTQGAGARPCESYSAQALDE